MLYITQNLSSLKTSPIRIFHEVCNLNLGSQFQNEVVSHATPKKKTVTTGPCRRQNRKKQQNVVKTKENMYNSRGFIVLHSWLPLLALKVSQSFLTLGKEQYLLYTIFSHLHHTLD